MQKLICFFGLIIFQHPNFIEAHSLPLPERGLACVDTVPPTLQLPADTLNCLQNAVTLQALTNASSPVYQWAGPGITAGNTALPNPQIQTAGLYQLTLTDLATGCSTVAQVNIIADVVPPITAAGVDMKITCISPVVTLDGALSQVGSNIRYLWTGPGIQAAQAEQNSPSVSLPGLYQLVVTDIQNGCTNTDFVTVTIDTVIPVVNAGPNARLTCLNRNTGAQLKGVGSQQGPGILLTWSGPGIPAGTQNNPNIFVTQPGTYTLAVLNQATGCSNTDQVQVVFDTLPPLAAVAPVPPYYCDNQLIQLDATPSQSLGGFLQFEWAGPGIMPGNQFISKPDINASGVYHLTVTDLDNGCTDTLTVLVPFTAAAPFTLDLDISRISCFKANDGAIFINQIQGGVPPYTYAFNSNVFGNSTLFGQLSPGDYLLKIKDDAGCIVDSLISLGEPPLFSVDLGPDLVIALGEPAQIQAILTPPDPVLSVQWNLAPGCDTAQTTPCLAFTYFPVENANHTVVVVDSNGCKATDAVKVSVQKKRKVYVGNIFNPSSDSPNNAYLILRAGPDVTLVEQWHIYDRWGNRVFESKQFQPNLPANAWDGSSGGRPCAPGVYIWAAQVSFSDGLTEWISGDITLIR